MDHDRTTVPDAYALPAPARGGVARFVQGIGLPLRATGFLLTRPHLWHLVALPLVVNVLLFAGILYWGFTEFRDTMQVSATGDPPWYIRSLVVFLDTVFWIVALLVVYFIFTPLALVLSAPFNDRLAERVERACGFALPDEGRSIVRVVASEVVFVLASECARMAVCIAVFVLLLPLLVVPPLYAAASFYWGTRCCALEFLSYAADRRHAGFGAKWNILRENYALTLGFGLATFALLMVPFVNVLVVPMSAVGGTFLFGLTERKSLSP